MKILNCVFCAVVTVCANGVFAENIGSAACADVAGSEVAGAEVAGVRSQALLPTQFSGDEKRGATLYQLKCTGCHAVDENRFGPAHKGVVGRRAGSLPGYKYSTALANANTQWTPQTLDKWLEDPAKFAPGQRMGIKVPDAKERADLIAYLATLK